MCDFGLDAFGKLELSYTVDVPCTVEIAFGEVLSPDGKLNRSPGGVRIAHVATLELQPGTGRVIVPPPVASNENDTETFLRLRHKG